MLLLTNITSWFAEIFQLVSHSIPYFTNLSARMATFIWVTIYICKHDFPISKSYLLVYLLVYLSMKTTFMSLQVL